jgi:DNA-directed RNA polymerase specialized sigma24 family protein
VEQPSTQVAGEPAGREADGFEAFVLAVEPRLRARVRAMPNAAGYLFRVAQSRSRGSWGRRRRAPVLFESSAWVEHRFEPGLPGALASLSERQRLAVVLVHGFGYTLREVAELTGVKLTTVQNHLERGLAGCGPS